MVGGRWSIGRLVVGRSWAGRAYGVMSAGYGGVGSRWRVVGGGGSGRRPVHPCRAMPICRGNKITGAWALTCTRGSVSSRRSAAMRSSSLLSSSEGSSIGDVARRARHAPPRLLRRGPHGSTAGRGGDFSQIRGEECSRTWELQVASAVGRVSATQLLCKSVGRRSGSRAERGVWGTAQLLSARGGTVVRLTAGQKFRRSAGVNNCRRRFDASAARPARIARQIHASRRLLPLSTKRFSCFYCTHTAQHGISTTEEATMASSSGDSPSPAGYQSDQEASLQTLLDSDFEAVRCAAAAPPPPPAHHGASPPKPRGGASPNGVAAGGNRGVQATGRARRGLERTTGPPSTITTAASPPPFPTSPAPIALGGHIRSAPSTPGGAPTEIGEGKGGLRLVGGERELRRAEEEAQGGAIASGRVRRGAARRTPACGSRASLGSPAAARCLPRHGPRREKSSPSPLMSQCAPHPPLLPSARRPTPTRTLRAPICKAR